MHSIKIFGDFTFNDEEFRHVDIAEGQEHDHEVDYYPVVDVGVVLELNPGH